ncbi:MAG TPA: alpha/beta hydrolase-fold protein [Bryobacteraceae bacterium]|nr:alpha/beta hydrolase-fold protein [Bryobacteraceae bacterium]
MNKWLSFVVASACLTHVTMAQTLLQSPEVHPDKTITFRLEAAKASSVSVLGEWNLNKPQPLTKDDKGIWSITIGPVPANIYIYVFNVDGVTITDPINPLVKLRARTSASMVQVPGGQPWEFRDVPHGRVEVTWHQSNVLDGAARQVFVYTPPGYDKDRSTRYPVLYLLHGSNDLAAGWTMAGNANFILDNFQADKKAVPMIVVMPWGHALPFGARPAEGQPGNNEKFEQYLVKEVMPMMESKYRVASGRKNRAVVGLSMGGSQALQIGMRHLDQFSAIGVFGAGMSNSDFESRYKSFAAEAKGAKKLDLMWIGVGTQDAVAPRAKELSETLRSHGIDAKFHETEGGHTYPVWRKLLVETAPLLFR